LKAGGASAAGRIEAPGGERDNVAELFAGVVASLRNVHAAVQDIFGRGNGVVVRVVVSGTQEGARLASAPPGATSIGTASPSTACRAARSQCYWGQRRLDCDPLLHRYSYATLDPLIHIRRGHTTTAASGPTSTSTPRCRSRPGRTQRRQQPHVETGDWRLTGGSAFAWR